MTLKRENMINTFNDASSSSVFESQTLDIDDNDISISKNSFDIDYRGT